MRILISGGSRGIGRACVEKFIKSGDSVAFFQPQPMDAGKPGAVFGGSYSSADAYFREDYFKKLQSTYASITLLEEECSIENQKFGTINNGAVKYVYTVESDGSTYKIMQYFSVYAGYLYILTYTAQESLFSEHLEEITSIVTNFVY